MANNPRSPNRDGGNIPPTKPDQNAATYKQSELRSPTFWVSILTLIVLGIYTFYSYQQVHETQTANLIAKKALTESEATLTPQRTRKNLFMYLDM